MIVLIADLRPDDAADAPVSPLNGVWYGVPRRHMTLPRLGHVFIICPLGETTVACSETMVDGEHYLFLTNPSPAQPYRIDHLRPDDSDSRLVLLMLSPAFMAEMADFLGIPFDMTHLLHGIPLLQGDALSQVVRLMADTLHDNAQTEELVMEAVGQVLRMLRLRHQSLLKLAHHKQTTVNDVIPRLLQARQFIEARYLDAIQTQAIAQQVALSEYHFARLFKTAFDISIHQYVVRLRLNKARHLLEASDRRITDIALDIGYNSLSAFIHAFRRYSGVTPSEYRSRFDSF